MKTTPTWKWFAAGVLALGLNGWYQTGGAQWAHIAIGQLARRSRVVMGVAKSTAHRFLGEARRLADLPADLPADLNYLRQPRMVVNRGCKQSSRPQSSPQLSP